MITKSNPEEFQDFLLDASNYHGQCEGVYFPDTLEDVVEIVKDANKNSTRITIAGNGTGLSGARVPEGGYVISTSRMNKITTLNEQEKYAIVQPGVILSELHQRLAENNLYYPPDPTEQNCFIGATVATNASGAKSFKYGSTRSFVLAMQVVLPTGKILNIKRGDFIAEGYELKIYLEDKSMLEISLPKFEMPKTKHAAGYFIKKNMDAIDLFIGSEGTLGLITEIKLKLLDLPEKFLSCVVFFNGEAQALQFISDARDFKNLDPLGLEFFDGNSLQLLKPDFTNIPDFASSAVWFEQEVKDANEDMILEMWIELIDKCGGDKETAWIATDRKQREVFMNFRHAVSWKVNEYITRQGVKKVGTDTAVPHEFFNAFYDFAVSVVKQFSINYVAYGHLGDSHLHLNMLPENNEEFQIAKKIYAAICRKTVELGGTISAEHGIGKLKHQYLLEMYGEKVIRQFAEMKKKFDPNLIMGIGNIFDSKYLL